ncbi:thiosulfate sulfurtransferase/rhodanese-like domain-containing protein 2 isoform X2 [Tubulanus polymorphus]|uniref:thiosulfate sulfurtransferase/rhodanese-like domain-containing protein 2 isoform X2 n=1 Tax=Tubulanus polymorphus TaxID=672921 RepID=UPI003DA620D2
MQKENTKFADIFFQPISESIMDKQIDKYAQKLAFSKFVASKLGQQWLSPENDGGHLGAEDRIWICCNRECREQKLIHQHCAEKHKHEIKLEADKYLIDGTEDARWRVLRPKKVEIVSDNREENSELPWLPDPVDDESSSSDTGQILLYYKYRWIEDPDGLLSWQTQLCERLQLTGKVRIGIEGINGTVGGSTASTETYIDAMLKHKLFSEMTREDFKKSPGSAADFSCGLKIGIYKEIVPMGIEPTEIQFSESSDHLSPEEFNRKVEAHLQQSDDERRDTVLIDCRNFYETKIGKFEGAVTPDIRKFSYWPEYVDKNIDLFENKDVLMYCTGGIRCERGSAYLKSKGICRNIYQLKGGIHRYIERFPNGLYRGKLFVFDDRNSIQSNDDVISKCQYCSSPWDTYVQCTSAHCRLLVLSCDTCRRDRQLTTCCRNCTDNTKSGREQCACTEQRVRIPIENSYKPVHHESEESS